MITSFDMYLICVADQTREMLHMFGRISLIGLILSLFFGLPLMVTDDNNGMIQYLSLPLLIIFFISSLAICLMPTSKQMTALYIAGPLSIKEYVNGLNLEKKGEL